jgi:cytochrome c553
MPARSALTEVSVMRTRIAIAWVLLFSLSPAAFGQDARLVARGTYLMDSIVACGNCHAQRDKEGRVLADKGLSGGLVFDEEPFKAYAPNITPDPETGIGRWTEAQIVRAIREGIRPDGSLIGPPMPIEFYHRMADDDARALAAYLKAQPPVKNLVPKETIVAPPRSDLVKYGEYLAGPLGHCMDCHSPWTQTGPDMRFVGAGGNPFKGPWGISVSANITPGASGLKGWTDAEIARAIREGVSRNGTRLKPPMAYDWYRNVSDDDMKALIAYLRSLKPLPIGGQPSAAKK